MVSLLLEFRMMQNHGGTRAVAFKALFGKSFFHLGAKTELWFRNLRWCKWIWQVMGAAVINRLEQNSASPEPNLLAPAKPPPYWCWHGHRFGCKELQVPSTVCQILNLCRILQSRWFADSGGLGESCAEAAKVILLLMNGSGVKRCGFLGRWLIAGLWVSLKSRARAGAVSLSKWMYRGSW